MIKPTTNLVLTEQLDVWSLCEIINPNSYLTCAENLNILIGGLSAVDVTGNDGWILRKHSLPKYFAVDILSTTLSFSLANLTYGQYNCSTKDQFMLDYGQFLRGKTIFNYFDEIFLMNSVVQGLVCPYIFANSRLNTLGLYGLVDSFFVTNIFKFQQKITTPSFLSINSSVSYLDLECYNLELDETLLDSQVFELLIQLYISGTFAVIQPDLFKSFKHLNQTLIEVYSLANFFHRVGVEWTTHVQIFSVVIFRETDSDFADWLNPAGVYTYPNSDLCLFSRMPLHLIVPVLESLELTVCTDTMTWLTQNYSFVTLDPTLFNYSSLINRLCWNFTGTTNMSAIRMQIDMCLQNSSETGSKQSGYELHMDYYDLEYIFLFVNDILQFILIPFASILGLLLNLRVIHTIYNNSKVELKEDFYKYMSLNSVFNCLFCIAYALYPINYCQRHAKGYFCSTIYNSATTQVIKIVLIGYLGETLKMCSNISYIFITINRYMLVGKKLNAKLERISKWNFRLVVLFTIIFSLLMNIGHAFQYRINWGWGELLGFSFLTYNLYPSIVNSNPAFNNYSIAYFVINFAFFLAINTIVEVSLLRNLRQEIEEKRNRIENEIQTSQIHNIAGSKVIDKVNRMKQKKLEQAAKKETRATVMVIANSVFNFVLRLPEILVFVSSNSTLLVSLIVNDGIQNFQGISIMFDIESLLVGVSYLFFIFTFTTNVAIYCIFNPNFKKHFILWKYYVKIK
jgi:hypothetical protein